MGDLNLQDDSARLGNKDLLVVGAGLHGLVTAKVMLHDSASCFRSVTIFEQNSGLGGVWSPNHIYKGLTTNSPLLTYEIPDFPYPQRLRTAGAHVSGQDVNTYLNDYAKHNGLVDHISYQTQVIDISWEASSSTWVVTAVSDGKMIYTRFGYVVICVGLYNTPFSPLKASETIDYHGKIFHSSQAGDPSVRDALAKSKSVLVAGAGKSAIDLATILARGQWHDEGHGGSHVTLVYRRPHWLSPRKIVRNLIPFEKLLFSRFIAAWIPFAEHPDAFHRFVAESSFGKWSTRQLFRIISDDFIKSNNQEDLPQTIPRHPLANALSGALHVEPPGYVDCVRNGSIAIIEGQIQSLSGESVTVATSRGSSQTVQADNILLGTGYKLALPFFSPETIGTLGLLKPGAVAKDNTNLSNIRLYRLIIPPGTAQPSEASNKHLPHRNIAFNGFAYNLLNPTVAHVTAHWISDYFCDRIPVPVGAEVEQSIDRFHRWQIESFGSRGVNGVHIGPHATLFTDTLLTDMALRTGHVRGTPGPRRLLREWFRPMLPEIYKSVAAERLAREECRDVIKYDTNISNMVDWQNAIAGASPFLAIIFVLSMSLAYILA